MEKVTNSLGDSWAVVFPRKSLPWETAMIVTGAVWMVIAALLFPVLVLTIIGISIADSFPNK